MPRCPSRLSHIIILPCLCPPVNKKAFYPPNRTPNMISVPTYPCSHHSVLLSVTTWVQLERGINLNAASLSSHHAHSQDSPPHAPLSPHLTPSAPRLRLPPLGLALQSQRTAWQGSPPYSPPPATSPPLQIPRYRPSAAS